MINLDEQLFIKIYSYCNETEKRTKFFETLNTASKPLFLVIYIICVFLLIQTKDILLARFVFYPASLLVINLTLRKIFKRKRPFENPKFQNKKLNLNNIGKSTSYSFPSNHASSSLIISFVILYINIYLGLTMLFLAVLTSFSRIARGYHYPLDILCSLVLSATLFILSVIYPLQLNHLIL